jgi:subtilisin family serine protease
VLPCIGLPSAMKWVMVWLVKLVSFAPRGFIGLVALAVFSLGNTDAKPIRLRNEIISPETPAALATPARLGAQNPGDDAETSGLFLIQFTSAPKPAWREQLRAQGVELLSYVPDDAFVAKLDRAKPGQIRKLNFVQWIGQYRTDYKLHSRLRTTATNAPNGTVEIAVLMSPQTSEARAAEARHSFQFVQQESRSRFGRVIRGNLSRAQLETLARSDSVLWIEPAPRMKLFDEVSSKIVAGNGGLHVLRSQSLGYDGSGVTVAVTDTGLSNGDTNTMHPDLFGRVTALFWYGSLADATDQHGHGTHCAGIIAGNGATGETDENGALYGLGVAPGANIVAQRMFDATGGDEPPPSFEKLTSDAKGAGADIGSNSWGDDTQGSYDLSAMEFDALVRDADTNAPGDQPYILEFSAGNAGPGPQTIASPAVAKNVIATGASQNSRTGFFPYNDGMDAMADFSSRGPCDDGRIKPDLVAPGTWIASLKSESASGVYAWQGISTNYVYAGGTSQAGPHVAGAAAVFVQYYRLKHTNATPSPALVKAALINSAVDMADPLQTPPAPNNDEGWGRVDLTQILDSNRNFDYVDQAALLTNNQTFERHVLVTSSDAPLKVTLAYTDVPGFPGAIPALVNDLDLEVFAPNGKSYHGNQFESGESVAGAPASDSINNVEGVFISTPLPGEYVVKIYARNVVADARIDTPATDQDFALVTSGHLAAMGGSVVVLDRRAYTAPGLMKITVIDNDIAVTPSVSVLVRSTTESAGEYFVLTTNGISGTFTGSVATVTGVAINDGNLQIAQGGSIEVQYFDTSAGSNRVATAVADLVPPVLTGVHVTNQFGHVIVSWVSDEPASSVVCIDTNSSLTRAVTNATMVTQHSVVVDGLIVGTNYFFRVSSTDEAGNTATNDNGGALFSFVAEPPATVLLVDDFNDDLWYNVPPLSGYTDALDQLGVSYEIWSTEGHKLPVLADLLAHRVVIWRLPEFNGTWSDTEQNALDNYLASGGSLFVASMQVLTRLDESPVISSRAFGKNTLKVQAYEADVTASAITGAANDPVGYGIALPLDYDIYQSQGKIDNNIALDVSDSITPTPDASPVFYNDAGGICGLRYPRFGQNSPGRLVFLSFPLDAVPMTEDATNNRVQLLGNALRFLAPGFDGRATIALDSPTYTVPSQVTVEVDDPDVAGSGSLNVNFISTTQTNATSLALAETPRRGTFRGFITLVAATNSVAPARLRVQHGDHVTAEYVDSSASQTNRAAATVDTQPPIIANVIAQPNYVQAAIAWNTDKPCDALVQYGESPLSFRTAYNPTPSLAHQIILLNLNPATLYYFRVVSRDAAGNAVTEDNGGTNYTFTTKQPLLPPWSDNMDGSAPGWTVSSAADTQSHWTRGLPNNGVATDGHSSPDAWGSNLNGDSLDHADTFLISPAIQLVGGDKATLTFWHNYSLAGDGSELGRLYLMTNDLSTRVELKNPPFDGDSGGWKRIEVDLTPYIGQVVNIVWHYELSSATAVPRAGWLVDGVSITIADTRPGTVYVTNNLWQAQFNLSGTVTTNGSGTWFVVTNAPPGEYVVAFNDIPYYQTPPPQTNSLPPAQTLLFEANYTFADANANGISDAWELFYFGNVSTNRTSLTDTDGDGMTDLAEFLAGTDPNSPLPPFLISLQVLTNGMIDVQWPSAPGHSYHVLFSTDFAAWGDISAWMLADGPSTNFAFLPLTDEPQFFRVEATDTAGVDGPAPTFLLTTNLLPDGSVELQWPSTPYRGYRVLCSTNAVSWQPCSDWIQAVGTTMTYTNPPLTNGAPWLFRVEVRP